MGRLLRAPERVGWSRGGTNSLKASDAAVINDSKDDQNRNFNSLLQALGIAARLAAGITALSAKVPQTSTPASQRTMPTVSPTLTFSTPAPTAMTLPTPSRPRMCGSGGLAEIVKWDLHKPQHRAATPASAYAESFSQKPFARKLGKRLSR